MTRGQFYSGGLHLALLVVAFLGLPSFFDEEEPQPQVLTVELLPIKDISNVKPSEQPIVKAKEPPAPQKQETPTPPKKSAPPPPPKKEAVPLPKEEAPKEKQEVKKKEEPKKEEEKPDESFEDALNNLEKEAANEKTDKPTKKKAAPTQNLTKSKAPYDPSLPLSISELDAVKSQIAQHWRAPAGLKDDYTLKVHLHVEVRPDGSVTSVEVASEDVSRYNSDPPFRSAVEAAKRAVQMASPLKNLPADKYSTWSSMDITFDPKDMLY